MARILMVEDDVQVLDRVTRTLESGGHQVMQAPPIGLLNGNPRRSRPLNGTMASNLMIDDEKGRSSLLAGRLGGRDHCSFADESPLQRGDR